MEGVDAFVNHDDTVPEVADYAKAADLGLYTEALGGKAKTAVTKASKEYGNGTGRRHGWAHAVV